MKILAVLLINTFAFTKPALFNAYQSPSYDLPNAISDCTYRGAGRREDCFYPLR